MSELWVSDADGGRQTRLRLNTTGRSVLWADWDLGCRVERPPRVPFFLPLGTIWELGAVRCGIFRMCF